MIVAIGLVSIGMFGLGFLVCLYLVFGSTVWLKWGKG